MNKTNNPYIDIATKIYEDIIDPWDRDPDATIESMAQDLKDNPLPAINYLLNMIEELRA